MNSSRAKELIESLESIKTAKFYHPNWAFIGFDSSFTSVIRQKVIRTAPLNEIHFKMTEELNLAIKPILDKYVKVFEEEIKKSVNDTTQ